MKTAQELFNTIAAHLLAQNQRAMNADQDNCLYRSPDGLKCAVGCLIPDALYNPLIEGEAVTSVFHIEAEGRLELPRPKLFAAILTESGIDLNDDTTGRLLREAQRIHDSYNPESWGARLVELADSLGLDNSVVTGRPEAA